MAANCRPPTTGGLKNVIVGKVVPDQTMSSRGFLSQMFKSFGVATAFSAGDLKSAEPIELLETLIEELHARGTHPILIVERFHSFAKVRDDAFLSILSNMRSLEHNGLLTTVAISPIGYDAIRREIASSLPFVNSSYGDNHDRAIMSPLSFEEFVAAADKRGMPSVTSVQLFSRGGGPDAVYQALLDEAQDGIDGIEERCIGRLGDNLRRFLTYAVGPLDDSSLLLLNRLTHKSATQADVAFLRNTPQSRFVMKWDGDQIACNGEVLRSYILRHLLFGQNKSEPKDIINERLRILLVTANSLQAPLDIEAEIRNVLRQMSRTLHRDQVDISHCQAATPDELLYSLRTVSPHIVHFSGHGNEIGVELRTEGEEGIVVSGMAIANALQGRSVKLAVFNVCNSSLYASDVARHVGAVVTTSDEVDDEASKLFAAAFYRTIVSGFTIGEAFQDGATAVEWYNYENVFELRGDRDMKLLRSPTT